MPSVERGKSGRATPQDKDVSLVKIQSEGLTGHPAGDVVQVAGNKLLGLESWSP